MALFTALFAPQAGAATEKSEEETARYIIVLKDSVENPGSLARSQTEQRDGELGFVYRHSFNGYSAELPKDAVEALRKNPSVLSVEPDIRGGVAAQTTPTGIDRIFASTNEALRINEIDEQRVDADVAVLDTGIAGHPDLDVVSKVNCTGSLPATCVAGGTDLYGHGTHVAGTIAAIDNGVGVVGVAPGARLWSVKVLGNSGFGNLSEFIAGIDWITARANQIEVANSSLRYWGETSSEAFNKAIKGSIDAGVVHVAAAGNETETVKYIPGNHPDVITVSALEDFDGSPGEGKDPLAWFSNFGSVVDVAAPGVDIRSTVPGGGYEGGWSGTSMASPHVAGAAAILAAESEPESKKDVEWIRDTIVEAGNLDWEDSPSDGVQEPLLDVSEFPIARDLHLDFKIGGPGSANGQFVNPQGLATDSQGNLYVADTGNSRIQKFNSKGEYLSQFGTKGSGNGQFSNPYGMVFDSQGNLYVADSGNGRIQKFNSKGEYLSQFGTKGSGNGQFFGPHDVDVDESDNVYVLDSNNGRVQKFNSKGEYLLQFGEPGTGPGQFGGILGVPAPKGIATVPCEEAISCILVTDTFNGRVQFFYGGEYAGELGGGKGAELEQFSFPFGIDVSPTGRIFIADAGNARVQVFKFGGAFSHFGPTSGVAITSGPGDVAWMTASGSYIEKWVP